MTSGALNRLLRELSSDGVHDSTGAFTVPVARARDKLRHFQLLDPSL